MKSSRSINKVLQEADDDLAILITRTKQLKRLTHQLRQSLDPNLAKHCYVAQYTEDKLIVLVDSAAWASKLRFEVPNLTRQLPQSDKVFAQLKNISIKILNQPNEETRSYTTITTTRPSLNEEKAQGTKTLADSVDDQALQQALTRLASHGEK